MSWVVFAVICLFFTSGYRVINQHYKINSSILMLYRGIGISILTFPLFYFAHGQSSEFYFYAILLGFINAYLDNVYLKGVAKFGAGPISRVAPLYIIFSLVIWWIVSPSSFFELIKYRDKSIGVIVSILVVIFALFHIKQDKLSKKVIKYCIGIYISSVCLDIFVKLMFLASDGSGDAVYTYMCVSGFIVGFVNFIFLAKEKGFNKKLCFEIFERRTLKVGLIIMSLMFGLLYTRNMAIILAVNPAYVSAFVSMSPVIIAIYNKLIKFEDSTNKVAGFLIVFGCIMLSYFGK